MNDSLVERYYKIIEESNNKLTAFVSFISEALDIKTNKNIFSVVGKLLKIYGKDILFLAVLDSVQMSDKIKDSSSLFSILNYFCKKRFEQKMDNYNFNDLTSTIKKYISLLERDR